MNDEAVIDVGITRGLVICGVFVMTKLERIRNSDSYRQCSALSLSYLTLLFGMAVLTWVSMFLFYFVFVPNRTEDLISDRVSPEVVHALMGPWRQSIGVFGVVTGFIFISYCLTLLRAIRKAKSLLSLIDTECSRRDE